MKVSQWQIPSVWLNAEVQAMTTGKINAVHLQVALTLVLNKVDRLILELRLTAEQAYERMKAVVTQINMIISAFQSEQYMLEADAVLNLQATASLR